MNRDSIRSRVIEFVDEHGEELVALLSELVRMPSIFPPGRYDAIAARMRDVFQGLGLRTSLVSAPRERIEAIGQQYPRPNVVALLEGRAARPVLMLGTHMDVVEVEDLAEWRFDPFAGTVSEGRVWGRGTCDAKCAMAAQVFAVRALQESGVTLQGSLLCVSSVDDEGRFDHLKWPGMTFLAEEGLRNAGFPMPDMVINGEASGLENICGSFKGRLILEIEVLGETAHAATPYGVNAIDQAVKLIDALRGIELAEHPLQGRETFNICALRGVANRYGDIPPSCSVGCEIRVVAPLSTERIRRQIDGAIERVRQADPRFRVGRIQTFSERQPVEIEQDHTLVTTIREAACAVGITAAFAAILGTGELQAFLARGIPGVTYGAGSIGRVHKANEYVTIDELLQQTKIYALTALNACGFEA